MQAKKQDRHEKLIDFLSQFSQYQDEDRKSTLKKIKKARTSGMVKDISIDEINKGFVVFTDVLNIDSGSAGNVNLYRLLQAYITIPEFRERINEVVKEAHSYKYSKSK